MKFRQTMVIQSIGIVIFLVYFEKHTIVAVYRAFQDKLMPANEDCENGRRYIRKTAEATVRESRV